MDISKKGVEINFSTVSKEAGVTRQTLYNNPQLKERIESLRETERASNKGDSISEKKKGRNQLQNERIAALREEIGRLTEENKKLLVQLIDYEETKDKYENLKKRVENQTK